MTSHEESLLNNSPPDVVPTVLPNDRLQRTVGQYHTRRKMRRSIVHMRRAGSRNAPPLNRDVRLLIRDGGATRKCRKLHFRLEPLITC